MHAHKTIQTSNKNFILDVADLAWFSVLLVLFCSLPGILRQPQHLARERETFGYLFCPCTPYGSRVSHAGEEEERKKENDDFRFFQNSFSRLV